MGRNTAWILAACLGFGLGSLELPAQELGIVGDADGNGVFDLADARYLEAYLAAGAEMAASPGRLSDVASPCDGALDGADVERLVRAGRQARQRASRSTPVVSECHGVVIGEPPPDLHAGGEEIPTLDDLYLAIAGEIPHFAGFYLNGDVPTVALTDPRDEVLEAARQALLEVFGAERLERGATFRAVAAEYGFAELQEQRLRIRPLLALPEVVGLDLDERRNRLVVNFRDEADLPRVAALLAADGVPEGMWVAEPGTLEPQGRFQAKARPLRGGRRVELPGTWWCTMGPVVDLAGVRGWLTNTHCSAIFGVQESSKIAQAAANDGLAGVETVDPFFGPGAPFSECEGHPCRWSDSAFFSTDLAEGRVPSWKGVVEAELQSPSGLTRRFITSVVDHPIDGEEVCKSGQKTEFTCGEVNKTCFDKHVVKGEYDWNYFLFCQFRASYDSGSGDSGSPVFQRHGTLEAKLFGLHHAEETAGPAIRLGGVFSPVSGLKKDLGPIDALRTDGAPKVVITQPLDSSSIGTGTTFPLDLQATYWDEEDGGGPCTDCLVTWSSDVDGALGVSPVQDGLATLHVTVWGQGTRIITAVATDSHPFNADGIDQITVTTGNAPPQIWIVSPAPGQQLWNGTEYLFLADSFDDQAFGPLDCSGFQWYLEGQPVGTGCSVPVTPTVNGILGVAVAGTDGQGAPGSDSTWVEVVDPPSGQPPHVEILSPGDNAALLPDQPVLVQGRGDDPDDASPLSYAWVLSGPGLQTTVLQTELAADAEVKTLSFQPDEHMSVPCGGRTFQLTLEVTDPANLSDSKALTATAMGPPC